MHKRALPLLVAALLLVGCSKEPAPEPEPATPAQPTAAVTRTSDAATVAVDAAPPPIDAAKPDAGWVEAQGPCKKGEPVTWCGRVWQSLDSDGNPNYVTCHSPRETSIKPLLCFERLAGIDISGSGIRDVRPLRKLEFQELTVGPEITSKQLIALRDLDAGRTITLEDMPKQINELWCGEGDLDGGDQVPSGNQNQHVNFMMCDTRIAAGCDGKGTATLRHDGRNKQKKQFVSSTRGSTRVTFTKRLKPLDGVYAVHVSVRCNDGKKVEALGRFWTQFMWAE